MFSRQANNGVADGGEECLGMSLSVWLFSAPPPPPPPPPVLLMLTTALLTNGRASLASRAQRALSTNQGSRPIVTTCAANNGPSLVVFSLGGLEMFSQLSPSCRLVERPLNTHRFVYRLNHLGGTVSAILTYIIELYKVFRNLYLCCTSVYSICNCFYAKLSTLNHISFFFKSTGFTIVLFLGSRYFLTQPTARKTKSGDPAQNTISSIQGKNDVSLFVI